MKKITSLLLLVFLCTQVNAQLYTKKIKGNGQITTTTRELTNYNKISIGGNFYVTLFKSNHTNLTIKSDENFADYIITEVKNGDLTIKIKEGYQLQSKNNIEVLVPFNQLESLALAGSGKIESSDRISTEYLNLSVAGSGLINLDVLISKINLSIAGSGNITLKGSSQALQASIAGSGNLNAHSLVATVVTVKLAGSGNANVHATNEINCTTAGSGNIIYTGNPTDVKVKSSGSGTIKAKN